MTYQLASRDGNPRSTDEQPDSVDFAFSNVLGESPSFREAVDFARRVAVRRLTTVLLTGETGTGKELFARGIHYAGPDPGQPFVAVNCPAIPTQLLESELFGHERGAFTDARSLKKGLFEVAGGGTIFLDEIVDLPADLQPKLLRALEERRVRRLGGTQEIEIRCRVIAATNRSLEDAVTAGNFREDLFYRLNVLKLLLPPLRERESDVRILAEHFSLEIADEHGLPPKELSRGAIAALDRHDWPGNVRELKNVIHRAALLSQGPQIEAEDVVIPQRGSQRTMGHGDTTNLRAIVVPDAGKTLDQIEAEAVRHTLEISQGNRSAASRMLGISRPRLLRMIVKHGFSKPDRRTPAADRSGAGMPGAGTPSPAGGG